MKILVLAESFPPDVSGGATFAYELSKKLVEKYGVKLTVITRDFKSMFKPRLKFPVIRIKVPTYKTEGGKLSSSRLKFIFATMKKVIELQNDYDLIHIYSGMSTETVIWLLQKMGLLRKPVVMSFLGTAVGFYQNIYKFPKSHIYNFLGKSILLGATYDKYMVLDDGTDGYKIFTEAGIPRNKLVLHYQAVDCNTFKPKKSKRKGISVIGFVGRLDPFKGVDTFIQSMVELNKKFQNFVVAIRGDGPLKDQILSIAKEGGILEKLKFLKPVSHKKLPNLINSFDVMVFPDIRGYKNPNILSLAMSEAMACRIIFVSSSKPRREWKARTWIRVSKPDPKEYAEKILDILKNPKKYESIKTNARKTAVRFFDWGEITTLHYENFLKLIQR